MLNLLISTTLFYPSLLGGPANTLYWLSKALVKAGVQVTVVTTDSHIESGKVEPDKWTDVEGIKVRYCNSKGTMLLKELWHTWREIKNADTVMLCDMFQRQILPVAFMARLRKKKIIWSPRGELMGPALAGSWMKRWYVTMVRFCFGRYATFHATSEEEKAAIKKYIGGDAKAIVIPNYIELPAQLKREVKENPYFLYVGRVTPIKALDRLIIGLAQSRQFKDSGFKLLIAGPNQNNYQQELEVLIAKHGLDGKVQFLGNVCGLEKMRLYANARFSCLLSHSENFGNVIIEALSQGTPVIASKGTPWQVLDDTNSGYWIDNIPESISKCVDAALSLSDEEYSEMRRNARELANSFDVEQNVGKWVEVI